MGWTMLEVDEMKTTGNYTLKGIDPKKIRFFWGGEGVQGIQGIETILQIKLELA